MTKKPNKTESQRILAVKQMPCIICNAPPINDAHHITEYGSRLGHLFILPLCERDHRGDRGFSGINRSYWDKSLANQLKLLEEVCEILGVAPPVYETKIMRRNLDEEEG